MKINVGAVLEQLTPFSIESDYSISRKTPHLNATVLLIITQTTL